MPPLAVLAVTFALAFLCESLVEYLFGAPLDHAPKLASYKWLLMYISAGVGVFLALYYRLDLIDLIAGYAGGEMEPSIVGQVLTGLAVGRGANYLSQFVSTYLKPKQDVKK